MIPNHVLVVGPPHSGKIRIAQDIGEETESSPVISTDSHSGLIFRKKVSTKYFSTNVNVLVDEYPEKRQRADGATVTVAEKAAALDLWAREFMADDMTELRDALDGVVFCLDVVDGLVHLERCLDVLESMRDVLTPEDAYAWPGFIVVVVSGAVKDEDAFVALEDLAIARGLECVDLNDSGYNEYKERVGRDRLKEVFESHEWSQLHHEETGPSTETTSYEQRKTEKLHKMTEPLLSTATEEEPEMELTDLLNRLSLAKEKAAGMHNTEQKEAYVHKVIDDIINYI